MGISICQSLTGVFDMSWFGALSNNIIVCKRREKDAERFNTAEAALRVHTRKSIKIALFFLRDVFGNLMGLGEAQERGLGILPQQSKPSGFP